MEALTNLYSNVDKQKVRPTLSFNEFVDLFKRAPQKVSRSIFQMFHDMVKFYVGKGINEYPNDPESIGFMHYDCTDLLVYNMDEPFFADRLFANRLMYLTHAMTKGTQQNKIYVFKGPPGCGKSVFLNSLLSRFQEYANSVEGGCYELVWRIPYEMITVYKKDDRTVNKVARKTGGYEEIPCPCHGHPFTAIPKSMRRDFIEELVGDALLDRRYEWLFREETCAVCSSIYDKLSEKYKAKEIFDMVYARPRKFDRKLGEGITIYNPADKTPLKQEFIVNIALQKKLDNIFGEGQVKYIHSRNAPTNNGIYALMDIKDNNIARFNELHNIISEGIRKVDNFEERVNSLFVSVTNTEDIKNITNIKSYEDRIMYIYTPYVLDVDTEISIYKNIFGEEIEHNFLPRVLRNFAKIMISSRLKNISKYIEDDWLEDPSIYINHCDVHWHLLKMEIYAGNIPTWLTEIDRKNFTSKIRRMIINKSEEEGDEGFSGRTSISMFSEFYTTYSKSDKLINMQILYNYFAKIKKAPKEIVVGFLDSLLQLYHYTTLQEMKEAMYDYNTKQISNDVQNYIYALNWDIGDTKICDFTGDRIEITEEFLYRVECYICSLPKTVRMKEGKVVGTHYEERLIKNFRENILSEYTSETLGQEIIVEGKDITETELYKTLYKRYTSQLKEKVLDTLVVNFNFRAAIKDYGSSNFNEIYDDKVKRGVNLLISNLQKKFGYTEQGAMEVCVYMLDNAKELEPEELTKETLAANSGGE